MIGDVWKGMRAEGAERGCGMPSAVVVQVDSLTRASGRGQGYPLRRFPGIGSVMIGRVAFGAVEGQGL